jgi:16S rRNA (guanine1516-N2)-methyltransferase
MQIAIYHVANKALEALHLASQIGITPIAAETYQLNADIIIFFNTNHIELIVPAISSKAFSIDFSFYLKHFATQNLKTHPLAQAIGLKNKNLTILDATAGFGKDTALINLLGHKVIALEQNPIVFAMLSNAAATCCAPYKVTNTEFIKQNSYDYLMKIAKPYPDIIYLDPMFPSKNKSNLVKKPMQILQIILADAPNNNEALLAIAIKKANKKVIVKRPQTAGPLANIEPDMTITKSQSTRYDIYLKGT